MRHGRDKIRGRESSCRETVYKRGRERARDSERGHKGSEKKRGNIRKKIRGACQRKVKHRRMTGTLIERQTDRVSEKNRERKN